MKSLLRILYLEDDKNDVELVRAKLEEEGFACDVIHVETKTDFIAALEKGGFNIILSDYNLPSFDGLSALAIAREKTPEIPFLFLSGVMGEELAIETLKNGATDYVLKQRLSRLGPSIHRALMEVEEHLERKKAEKALKKLSRQNELILNSASEGIFGLDVNGNHTFVNSAAAQMLDYRVKELIGKHSHKIWHHSRSDGSPYPEEECPIYNVCKYGIIRRVKDEVFWRKDGTSFPVAYTSTPILEGGKLIGCVVTFRDITKRKREEEELRKHRQHLKELVEERTTELKKTNEELQLEISERKRAEEALQINEEKYRMVADFTYDWEDWLDSSGKYIYVSPSCEWITGYGRDEFLNTDQVIKITHPDDRELVRKHFHEVLSASVEIHHIDFRIITRSGQMRWISHYCQPVYGKDGSFHGRRSSNRDITERKKAEQDLQQLSDDLKQSNVELQSANNKLKAEMQVRERMQNALELSEERYKKMVDAVTAYTYSVQVSKGNAIYTEHSIGCLPITGYRPDEFKSDPNLWYSMIYPDDKIIVENTIKEILAGHKAPTIEHRIIRRDGAVIWIRNTMAPYYNDDGALIRYDGLIEDISGRKHAEEELKCMSDALARSNADLQQFAYAASHDLQGPLNVVEMYLSRLLRRYKDKLDVKAGELIGSAIEVTNGMKGLMEDLLEYSKAGTKGLNLKPANFSIIVDKALFNLQLAIKESGALVTRDELPTVMADASQMGRIFQNLIDNAIKFHDRKPLTVHVSAEKKGVEWVFSVRDNGIGIDPKQAEKIFVVFQRLHTREEYPGTGIGLAICKRIIERHGGRIWVESEPENGSTFYFTIPDRQA